MAFSSPRKRRATALDKLHLQTKRECWGDDHDSTAAASSTSLVDGQVPKKKKIESEEEAVER